MSPSDSGESSIRAWVIPLLFAAIVIVASTASAASPSDTGALVALAPALELVVGAAVAVPANALVPAAAAAPVDVDSVAPVVPVASALAPRPALRPAAAFTSG